MIIVGYLISILFVALGADILYSARDVIAAAAKHGPDQASVLKLAQVAMAFVGAIATAVLTATVGRSNEYLKSQLTLTVNDTTERLRAKLAEETGASLERLRADLAQTTAATTEQIKADMTRTGDAFRAEINQLAPRRHAAYHAMWAALAQYYRAVQKFEAGTFDAGALEAAERTCADAAGQALLADRADDDLFHQFWQELTYVHEAAVTKKDLSDGLQTLWRNEGQKLGERYNQVREAFAQRLKG